MTQDLKNDDKKCDGSFGSPRRAFKLSGANAEEKKCIEKCANDTDCVAMSGIWKEWCIGCKLALNTPHQGAKAFKKDEKGNSNVRPIEHNKYF